MDNIVNIGRPIIVPLAKTSIRAITNHGVLSLWIQEQFLIDKLITKLFSKCWVYRYARNYK